jgi:mannose-6-phosphate isomerase-like protein (cupin superfamily)
VHVVTVVRECAMTKPLIVSFDDLKARLPAGPATEAWPNGIWFADALRHGSMSVELYAPRERDYQRPHGQDELYVVVTGRGVFEREGDRVDYKPGDVIFVPAGAEHRFVDFTADFAAWVIFWGPEGGETDKGTLEAP